MSFRKIPSCCYLGRSHNLYERQIKTSQVFENGKLKTTCEIVEVPHSEISKSQLDPRVVTLASVIESGVPIEVGSSLGSLLDAQDPATIKEMSSPLVESAFNFIKSNKE